jgi:hypothetical protein
MTTFARRLLGAAALDAATFEEVEADRTGTVQAMSVVILSALAAGVGARGFGAQLSLPAITVIALLAWAAWALLTYEIGAKLLPEASTRVDVYELLRTIGFASAPGLLRVIGVVPALTRPIFLVTAAWMLLSMIVAVRQALDYTSTVRAVAVCVIGWALTLAIILILGLFVMPHLS